MSANFARTLAALALCGAMACQSAPPAAQVHRFDIGTLHAAALKDGDIELPNDGKEVGLGASPQAVGELLKRAGLASDVIRLSMQPLLVQGRDKTMLFDTGAGDAKFADGGRLPASLRAAGVAPAQVSDIFISHAHPDHVGGLLTREGALAFPNAAIHLSDAQWAAMQSNAEAAPLVAKIAPKVVTFRPGAQVLTGVTAVDIPGHTPGHSGYEIVSQGKRLFYIGDAAHHFIVSVQRAQWGIGFDQDQAAAKASRLAVLQRAADENLLVYAYHFPFPGLGHVRRQGESFVWAPQP